MYRYAWMASTILGLLACTDALCADAAPGDSAGRKAGWSDAELSMFTAGCVQGVVDPAKRDYAARAEQEGNKSPKPFPEDKLRASVEPMCSCLGKRISETWTYEDYMQHQMEYARPLIEEAMRGGQCKPGGMMGEMMEKKAAAPPK